VLDLRLLHQRVLDEELNPDTFRRNMMPFLEQTADRREGARGKPARLCTIAKQTRAD